MVTCYNTSEKISGERSGIVRRGLASGEQEEEEEDESFADVISACLDLQAEIGYPTNGDTLPQKGEVIRDILAEIEGYEETVQAVEGIKSPPPPSLSTEALLDAEFHDFTLSEFLSSEIMPFDILTDPLSPLEQFDLSPASPSSSSQVEWLSPSKAAEWEELIHATSFPDSFLIEEEQQIVSEEKRKKRSSLEAGFSESGTEAKRQAPSPAGSDEGHSKWFLTEQSAQEDILAAAAAIAGVQPEEPGEAQVAQLSPSSEASSSVELSELPSLEVPCDPGKVLVGFVEEFTLVSPESLDLGSSSERLSSTVTNENLSTHRNYRIPLVDKEGIKRTFNMSFAFEDKNYKPLMPTLRHMRALLELQTLNAEQAEQLMIDAENIVSYLVQTQKEAVAHKPVCRALWLLGRRYLLLDGLACAIQALGPAMTARLWWPQLAAMIPCEFRETEQTASPKKFVRITLVLRLSSALKLLKSGIRPTAEETVHLKRDLFSHAFTLDYFKSPMWDDWREAD
ncbi:hypothetical protein Emed_003320 [Eimeria media]